MIRTAPLREDEDGGGVRRGDRKGRAGGLARVSSQAPQSSGGTSSPPQHQAQSWPQTENSANSYQTAQDSKPF